MNEIDHFKKFILYSGDMTVDVDHLYVKRNLVNFSYIVPDDSTWYSRKIWLYSVYWTKW
jgi:hypothetical protein